MFNFFAGDRIEVRFYCWCEGAKQLGINTVRFLIATATPGGPIDSQDFSEALSDNVAVLYKAVLDTSCKYLGLSVQDFPARTWYPDFSNSSQGFGSVAGNDAPSQVSGLISFKTQYGKPSGRGRIYVPFPSVTSNGADGLPTTAYLDELQVLASLFESTITVTMSSQIVTMNAIVTNSTGTGPTKFINKATAVQKWATQRRRGSYGRLNTIPTELQPD